MAEAVVTVDVSKVARLQRALKWASGTKQVSCCVVHVFWTSGKVNTCFQNISEGISILTFLNVRLFLLLCKFLL